MCSVCTCRTGSPVQVRNVSKYNTHKMLHNPKIKQLRPECFPNTSHLQIVVLICTEVTGTSDSSGSCFDSFSNQEPEFLRSWVNKKTQKQLLTFWGQLLVLIRDHVATQGELIYLGLLPAQVKDPDLGICIWWKRRRGEERRQQGETLSHLWDVL